jgi:hypothetical protein
VGYHSWSLVHERDDQVNPLSWLGFLCPRLHESCKLSDRVFFSVKFERSSNLFFARGHCKMVTLSLKLALVFTSFHLILAANVTLYPPLYAKHSHSTPVFLNTSGKSVNPLIKALNTRDFLEKRDLPTGTWYLLFPCH